MDNSGVPAPVAAFLDDSRVGTSRLLARPVTSNKLSSAVILRKREKELSVVTKIRIKEIDILLNLHFRPEY